MKHLNHYIFEALGGEVNGFCILKPEFLEHQDNFCSLLTNFNKYTYFYRRKSTFFPKYSCSKKIKSRPSKSTDMEGLPFVANCLVNKMLA